MGLHNNSMLKNTKFSIYSILQTRQRHIIGFRLPIFFFLRLNIVQALFNTYKSILVEIFTSIASKKVSDQVLEILFIYNLDYFSTQSGIFSYDIPILCGLLNEKIGVFHESTKN